ncbi:MAG: hypothetical protein P9F19_12320 [Candidatus Contendobacter sp.]|nr:hypothetical protein [Candidatus Contendobacter sp.]MDG4558154.1 hypothetical protein [Candidatus Contendobacter sp.]
MTKDKQQAAIESNASFGPIEFDYYPVGAGGEWFAKWLPGYPAPSQGYKIHVSARLEDAEIVARAVLPVLRRLRVAHKVVRDLDRYRRQIATSQRGKFITVYTQDASHAQRVLSAINPELQQLRDFGGIQPGPSPTTRESGHREAEIPVGGSGLVWTRWYDEGDQD